VHALAGKHSIAHYALGRERPLGHDAAQVAHSWAPCRPLAHDATSPPAATWRNVGRPAKKAHALVTIRTLAAEEKQRIRLVGY
jgi:hypothetical protein